MQGERYKTLKLTLVSLNKAQFSYVGKIPNDRGFHCFLTVPDFAEIRGNLRYLSVIDANSIYQGGGGHGLLGGVGNWIEAIWRIRNELKVSPTSLTEPI